MHLCSTNRDLTQQRDTNVNYDNFTATELKGEACSAPDILQDLHFGYVIEVEFR